MRLSGKSIAILIAEGVEDYEYFVPLMRLQEEGARVLSAGMDLKPFKGKNGLAITPDICHGGSTAISAGIIKKGQRATGSTGIKDDLVNAGAVWVDEPAFREGNQVWGRVVADIPDFNRELVKALVEG